MEKPVTTMSDLEEEVSALVQEARRIEDDMFSPVDRRKRAWNNVYLAQHRMKFATVYYTVIPEDECNCNPLHCTCKSHETEIPY